MLKVTGDAVLEKDGVQFTVPASDITLELESSEEKNMGPCLRYSGILNDEKGEDAATLDVWEYPVGTIECEDIKPEPGYKVIESPSVTIDNDWNYEADAWLDSKNSLSSLQKRISELSEFASNTSSSFQHMMIYSFCVTVLEVYLSEIFIKKVLNNTDTLGKYLHHARDFQDRKFTVKEIIDLSGSKEKLNEITKESIQKIVFHNMPRIKPLYKEVLGINLDIADLAKYINTRHDLVHRAGKTKSGEDVSVGITEINGLIQEITKTVLFIENNPKS